MNAQTLAEIYELLWRVRRIDSTTSPMQMTRIVIDAVTLQVRIKSALQDMKVVINEGP